MKNNFKHLMLFTVFLFSNSCEYNTFGGACYRYKKFYLSEIKGKIVKKYIDWENHSTKYLVIEKLQDDLEVNYKIWNNAKVGDSVIKKHKSDILDIISKKGLKKRIRWAFNCPSEKRKSILKSIN